MRKTSINTFRIQILFQMLTVFIINVNLVQVVSAENIHNSSSSSSTSSSSKEEIIIIAINNNDNKTAPVPDDTSLSPYNERVIIVLSYFGLSLVVGIPILMCLLCFYRMRGSSPCNFREACCNC